MMTFESIKVGIDTPVDSAVAVDPVINTSGDYVCTADDYNKTIVVSSSSPKTVTIPTPSMVPSGAKLQISNAGASSVNIAGYPNYTLYSEDTLFLSYDGTECVGAIVKAPLSSPDYPQWVGPSKNVVATGTNSFVATGGGSTFDWGRSLLLCEGENSFDYVWGTQVVGQSSDADPHTGETTVTFVKKWGAHPIVPGNTYTVWFGIIPGSIARSSMPIAPVNKRTGSDPLWDDYAIVWSEQTGPIELTDNRTDRIFPVILLTTDVGSRQFSPANGFSIPVFNSGLSKVRFISQDNGAPIIISGVESPILSQNDSITLTWDKDRYSGIVQRAKGSLWERAGVFGAAYVDATTFTVEGDMTSIFSTNRRIQAYNNIYDIYATGISRWSTYSSATNLTTVTCRWENGGIDTLFTTVEYSVLAPKDIPCTFPIADTASRVLDRMSFNHTYIMNSATPQTYTLPSITDIPYGAFYVFSNYGNGVLTLVGTINGITNPTLTKNETAYVFLAANGAYGGILPNKASIIKTASFTLMSYDRGKTIITKQTAAITATIDGLMPNDSTFTIVNAGTGGVTILPNVVSGASVTVNPKEQITILKASDGSLYGRKI